MKWESTLKTIKRQHKRLYQDLERWFYISQKNHRP